MDIGMSYGDIKIFSCNSNRPLAEKIAKRVKEVSNGYRKNIPNAEEVNIELSPSVVSKFQDGEICLKIEDSVRECDVYIIQSTSYPVNDNLMELLIMIDAMRRASAKRITAVIPYYGYARQDRKSRARDPISAKLVANLLTSAGADRILTMDLHCAQIQGFFDIPVDHLVGMPILYSYYMSKFRDTEDVIVVSPDLGSVGRARALAEKLNVNLAIVDKRRYGDDLSQVLNVIGDVAGKKVILVDDEIDTGGSIVNAAKAMKEAGAVEVNACCTHGKFSGAALEKLQNSPLSEVVVLDTILLPQEKHIPKIKVLSVSEIFALAIYYIHEGKSVSVLFD